MRAETQSASELQEFVDFRFQIVEPMSSSVQRSEAASADDDAWAECQTIAKELRQQFPNAEVTNEGTVPTDIKSRRSEERVNERLLESRRVLERMQAVKERLDDLRGGGIVLLGDWALGVPSASFGG